MKFAYLFMALWVSGSVFAQENIKVEGTLNVEIKAPISNLAAEKNSLQTNENKTIKLLKFVVSESAKKNLGKRTSLIAVHRQSSKYPSKVDLGMNKLPVLNQGMHGTCVTFAISAAIDALLNKGDYLSQLCQLQLGNYLAKNAYSISGWEGSIGSTVLNQIKTFGIISKEREIEGCGGLTSYPGESHDVPEGLMTVEEYRQRSEDLSLKVGWSSLLDLHHAVSDRFDSNKTLEDLKIALNAGDRVTFGVLFPAVDLGLIGAVGKHHVLNDTWVLTQEIMRDLIFKSEFAGHEMVITGYDDQAVALDDQGMEHRGLLKMRNSWGERLGDKGDFYMSYDYFKLLVIEAQRIRDISGESFM